MAVLLLGAAAGACADDGGDRDAFCATAERFAADNPADAFARIDTDDPAATATALRDAATRLGEWADQAPGDVRDDVRTLADAATTLAERFEADPADGSTDEFLAVDATAVAAASDEVLGYARDECGVELDLPISVSG